MRTREDSRRTLAALNLPPIVTSIFEGVPIHEALRYRCEPPLRSFAALVVAGGDITPLWECSVSVTAYQHSPSLGRFIRFSLESPEEIRVLGSRFAAVVADLLITLWEDDASETDLREVAGAFEFEDVDRLLAELTPPRELSLEAHRQWLTSTLARYEKTA